jgi:hypothetical protein
MNEITIYRRIKDKFDDVKKDVKYGWWIIITWMVESVVFAITLNMFPVLMYLFIFIPMAGVITYIVLAIRKEFLLAKRFPLVYNNWLNSSVFLNQVISMSNSRAQPDPNKIKIDNYGLEYIDNLISQYGGDNQKVANSFYNAISTSSLVDEVVFYKKFKRFTKDMEIYRNSFM